MDMRRAPPPAQHIRDQFDLAQQQIEISAERRIGVHDLGVATAEPAQRVAERDMDIEGQRRRRIERLEPAAIGRRIDARMEMRARWDSSYSAARARRKSLRDSSSPTRGAAPGAATLIARNRDIAPYATPTMCPRRNAPRETELHLRTLIAINRAHARAPRNGHRTIEGAVSCVSVLVSPPPCSPARSRPPSPTTTTSASPAISRSACAASPSSPTRAPRSRSRHATRQHDQRHQFLRPEVDGTYFITDQSASS